MKYILSFLLACLLAACNSTPPSVKNEKAGKSTGAGSDAHGWIETETLKSRLGDFEFRNGYPTADAVKKLSDALVYNRAIEVYLDQMHAVSWYNVWKGVAAAGAGTPNQLVIWESLMDSETLLLTGNTETVYGLASLDLKRDGPVVIELPAMMLGGISDMWQNELAGIGPTGADKGLGGKFLLLPPGYSGKVPGGYITLKCTTFKVSLGVRGFMQDGKPDKAVALMKTTKIYPLSAATNPPATSFVNGSGKEVNTIFSDNYHFFEDLAELISEEPDGCLQSNERFLLASVGIEKGKSFQKDADRKALLEDAAKTASAMARVNSFASSDTAKMVYSDKHWEWAFVGGSATWDSQGYVNTDRRAAFAYIAIGMSPAMVKKIVGGGSQYLWTPRDANGEFLDGGKNYQLHIPGNIPVKNFWSVVVYDAQSRSMLRNGNRFPSLSQYSGPQINSDGSVDVYFGPDAPKGKEKNWIKTVAGKGWFPLMRFYGPLAPYFDQTWKPDDIRMIAKE
ncbi:DUF1254 domain-containing protein [Chitinophaga arvensicola]|uniref:Uncharacterized conserved protein n=1 Tax=Chitinophaga arvensicola TaxID=29529 RepID=A0A1I0S9Q7_9BACT|nr:DUF1254 domain-containing protein [Chitinophaga arvensicola]SEW52828.1 Uncharacterized conserved protein [Chitinophaga arvensicola]